MMGLMEQTAQTAPMAQLGIQEAGFHLQGLGLIMIFISGHQTVTFTKRQRVHGQSLPTLPGHKVQQDQQVPPVQMVVMVQTGRMAPMAPMEQTGQHGTQEVAFLQVEQVLTMIYT